MARKALLIMGIQNDYCMGGSMGISKCVDIIPKINKIKSKFDCVFYIKDWYPHDHKIFKSNGGKYPNHCIQHSSGAKIHKFLKITDEDKIIHKNTNKLYTSKSAFYNATKVDDQTPLNFYLEKENINDIYVCGLRTDCLYITLLDAYKFRYKCYYIYDVTINNTRSNNHIKKLGIKFVKSVNI
uniref:nicotinamidase n=1 Tax=Mimivirus LCMiAC02 TaxID=2506609 RepID=A0A4D5XF35_9VIRU|nr:MAG: isochorismatase family protein [Mimivirus LCMiAC02]